MADQTVTVQFKTIAELEAAEQYLDTIEKSIGKTKAMQVAGKASQADVDELQKSYDALSESIEQNRQASSDQIQTYASVASAGTDLIKTKQVLIRLLGQLSHGIPGLSLVTNALRRSMGLLGVAVAAAGAGILYGVNALKKWAAEVAAARATAEAFKSIQTDLDNVYQSEENVREGISNIAKALSAAQGPAKSASDLLGEDNKALAEAAKLTDELSEAEKQRALAQVEYRVSAGAITEEEGRRLKEQIELQGRQANRQKEIERTEAELGRVRKAARAEEVSGTKAGAMAKTFPTDREALLLQQQNAEKALKGMEGWDKKVEDYRKQAEKAEERAHELKTMRLQPGLQPKVAASLGYEEWGYREKAKGLKEQADAMARQLDQQRTLKKRADDAIRQNDEAMKEWQSTAEKSLKAAKTLGETADALQKRLDALKAHAEKVGGVETQTAWYGEQVSRRSEAEKKARDKMEEDRKRVQSLEEAAKARGGTLPADQYYEMEAKRSRLKAIEETPEAKLGGKMIETYGTGGELFTPGYTPTAGKYAWPGEWTKSPAYQLNELAGQAERMASQPINEAAVERLAAALANIGAMVRGSVELTRRVDAIAAQIETLYSQVRTNRGTE